MPAGEARGSSPLLLVAGNEASEAEDPCEQALDLPPTLVAAQLATVLGLATAPRMVRRDHVDAHRCELAIEWVAVVGLVADEDLGKLPPEEALLERSYDELLLISLTTFNPDGDRKARAVCHCHDLGRLAASSDSNKRAPLLPPQGAIDERLC